MSFDLLQSKILLWATVGINTILQLPTTSGSFITAEKITSIGMLIIAVIYLELQLRSNNKKHKDIIDAKDTKIDELHKKVLEQKDDIIALLKK